MQFLESRSETRVTGTQLWYATLHHPNMHPHIKFEIPTSNNMRYAPDTIILKTWSEVKVTVTWKWYATLRHSKMHTHTKFGIASSKNIGECIGHEAGRTDWQTDRQCDYYMPPKVPLGAKKLLISPWQKQIGLFHEIHCMCCIYLIVRGHAAPSSKLNIVVSYTGPI